MKYQGKAAETFARSPDPEISFALVFGEDEGVVGDLADQLISVWQNDGPSALVTLDEDSVKSEPAILFDALEAQSLLGETTILRIRTKGDKLTALFADAVKMAEQTPGRLGARLVIMSRPLKAASKLRKLFEASARTASLHVFSDTQADLQNRIRGFLEDHQVEITPEALTAFVAFLPGHRGLANAEMEKLALYAHDLGRPIAVQDIRALCEENADENVRLAVMKALSGDVAGAQAELDRVIDAGLSAIGLLRQFEMEASRMLTARSLGGGNVGMKLKPPVWQSEWPAFEARMKKWPMPRLLRLLERIHDIERDAKRPGGAGTADAQTRTLFMALAKAAA